jgi:long-chain fatty acid transport protein
VNARAWALAALLAAAAGNVRAAHAAGYFSGTKGARAAGRAGAFTAGADDLSAVMFNPARLTELGGGLVLQVGNRFSYNAFDYTRDPTFDWGQIENNVPPYHQFATVQNQTPWQLLDPLIGVASNLGRRDWTFALAAYAPPGVARQSFPEAGGQRYMMVSREAVILNYTASVAWRYHDLFGVGVSLQWIHVPRISYALVIEGNNLPRVANPVASELDMLATVTGSDPFTFNAILGAWLRPLPFLELGLSGQVIPTQIQTNSRLSVRPQSELIDEPVVLKRGTETADDVKLTLPLPLTARAGARYVHRRGGRTLFDLELNVGYESWSRVGKFTVDGNGLQGNLLGQQIPVGLIEVDKRWRDTISLHLGGDVVVVPGRVTLRGGLFYETAVANRSHANVDFVSASQRGAALGASLFVRRAELAIAYEFRQQPTIRVSEAEGRVFQEAPGSRCVAPFLDTDNCHARYLGRPAPVVNAGSYAAHSHIVVLDLLYRF